MTEKEKDQAINEGRCLICGTFMEYHDNSYLSENGWFEDEGYECVNPECRLNKKEKL